MNIMQTASPAPDALAGFSDRYPGWTFSVVIQDPGLTVYRARRPGRALAALSPASLAEQLDHLPAASR
jgi:hypothetical protein